ncbi:PREDICTED: C-C chemokine receptor type 10 isoform X2 [Condylura cristata]|uniref:C-C chemokine receptor type 10 isoform X2 n=1 Tax=Condylura cristata TaxID=143302 RepID=UPI0003343987|nr:PREDICTED: C-C chemokine receptor type 10 isoform X2 [Condylura cristata]
MGTESTQQVSWGPYSGEDKQAYSAEPLPEFCDKEDVRAFREVFLLTVTLMAAGPGLIGNSLVLATHLAAQKATTRSPSSAHLLQLALADLFFALSLFFAALEPRLGRPLGTATCAAIWGLYTASFYAGFFFLALISINRYIVFTKTRREVYSLGVAHFISVSVWLVSLLLALPAAIYSRNRQREGRWFCSLVFPESHAQTVKGISAVAQASLGFPLPLGIMMACYLVLGRTLLAARGPARQRALRVVVALVAAFVMLQLPYSLVLLWDTADLLAGRERSCPSSKRKDVALVVTGGLAFLRCAVNPVLYAFLGLRFRQELRRLLTPQSLRRLLTPQSLRRLLTPQSLRRSLRGPPPAPPLLVVGSH